MRKATLVKEQLLRQSVHIEKSYLNKTGYPVFRCCTKRNSPLVVALGQRKIHLNSDRHQAVHRDKVDP